MRSLLRAADYTQADVLARENSNIFGRLWIVAGFLPTVDELDSFITTNIGGVPVLLQRTSDGLRAFVNQCAHRQSPVQLADFGIRRMACPYHGWVYGPDGRVKSIPGQAANYGFDSKTMCSLGLREVSVESIGGLVFVNLADTPMRMEEQFADEFRNDLDTISSHVGDDAIFAKFEARYNWKLNFENVVDWNHVPFVHASSFASLMPGLKPALSDERPSAPPPVSDDEIEDDLRSVSYIVRAPFDFIEWPWHELIHRCGPTREYINLFIYPNVNYVVMAGCIHLIQQFCPVAPDLTRVRLTMALGRKRGRLPAAAAILWSQMKSEKRVINEDVLVLEGLQRGLGEASMPAIHGWYEHRVRRAAKVYQRLLAS